MEVLHSHKKRVLLALGSRIGSDIAFYVFTLFLLVYLPTHLRHVEEVALHAVLAGAVAQCIAIPFFGHLCDKFGRRPVILFGAVAGIVWSFAFFALVNTKVPALIMLASFVALFIVAAMYAPLASYIPEMFPTRVRCTGSSIGFQLAAVFGGAPAPLIAVPLVAAFGSSLPVSIYLAATLVLIVVCVLAATETAHKDLRQVDRETPESGATDAPAADQPQHLRQRLRADPRRGAAQRVARHRDRGADGALRRRLHRDALRGADRRLRGGAARRRAPRAHRRGGRRGLRRPRPRPACAKRCRSR